MTDFEALIQKALTQGEVDEPIKFDHSEAELRKMAVFENAIVDLIEQHDIDDQSVTTVLVTMIGRAIVSLTDNAPEAIALLTRVISVMIEVMHMTVKERTNAKCQNKPPSTE